MAQTGNDTLALYDFSDPASVTVGAADDHAQTSYASTWHRVQGLADTASAEFQNHYPTYVGPMLGGNLAETMDSSFMLMSMWDSTVTGVRYNAWFEIGPIDVSQAQLVEIRIQQFYRKYYDTCFVDYTDATGAWHTMEINVGGIDVQVTGWGTEKYGFTVPEGVPGTNPTDLSRSPLLRKL